MPKVMCEFTMCQFNSASKGKEDIPKGECQKDEINLLITPGRKDEEALECAQFKWGED